MPTADLLVLASAALALACVPLAYWLGTTRVRDRLHVPPELMALAHHLRWDVADGGRGFARRIAHRWDELESRVRVARSMADKERRERKKAEAERERLGAVAAEGGQHLLAQDERIEKLERDLELSRALRESAALVAPRGTLARAESDLEGYELTSWQIDRSGSSAMLTARLSRKLQPGMIVDLGPQTSWVFSDATTPPSDGSTWGDPA